MATATIPTGRYTQVALKLRFLSPFKTHGALRGDATFAPFDALLSGHGWLPGDWSNTLQARSHVVDYIVWSYRTPIAWHDKETGWIIPDERYSVTTSRHQGVVRAALTYPAPRLRRVRKIMTITGIKVTRDAVTRRWLAHVPSHGDALAYTLMTSEDGVSLYLITDTVITPVDRYDRFIGLPVASSDAMTDAARRFANDDPLPTHWCSACSRHA